jgi:NAD(P)H dehydrogenase (quinone)
LFLVGGCFVCGVFGIQLFINVTFYLISISGVLFMVKILVVYYTRTGHTEKMAELVGDAARDEGAEVTVQHVDETDVDELPEYDALAVGSPTYYGSMAWPIKKLIDDSVKHHGDLDGMVGAAFSSAANVGGGNETTVRGILDALLIHGMIVQGDPEGDHYGAVAINTPDGRANKQCTRLGKRLAGLTKALN